MINSIVSKKSLGLSGEIKIPGDKSISHRALIIGSSVNGIIKIYNILESDDVLATANALKNLGIIINKISSSEWEIKGNGIGTLEGNNPFLDMGNSGTGVRLLMGLVAGSDVEVTFSGDYSLNNRPMARVIEPLLKTGAIIKHNNNTLPIKIRGSKIPLPYHIIAQFHLLKSSQPYYLRACLLWAKPNLQNLQNLEIILNECSNI